MGKNDFVAGYMAATRGRCANIEWREEYDGSLWAIEDAGDAGNIQFHIMPPDDGAYWWSAYAVDPDLELGDDIARSLEDAKQSCENILRDVQYEFTAKRNLTAGHTASMTKNSAIDYDELVEQVKDEMKKFIDDNQESDAEDAFEAVKDLLIEIAETAYDEF